MPFTRKGARHHQNNVLTKVFMIMFCSANIANYLKCRTPSRHFFRRASISTSLSVGCRLERIARTCLAAEPVSVPCFFHLRIIECNHAVLTETSPAAGSRQEHRCCNCEKFYVSGKSMKTHTLLQLKNNLFTMVEPEFTLLGPVREKPEGRNPTAACLE